MSTGQAMPFLSARGLEHTFAPRKRGLRGGGVPTRALQGVSFDLARGECLAVVGESGAGKTTLARCLLRLIQPTGGEVWFRGVNVLTMTAEELLGFRKKAQMVFQDPSASLNPRLRAGPMLEEILQVHGVADSPGDRRAKADQLLELVGLHRSHFGRYPHEFSGGQRQRIGIARALSVEPELLVLDEPVSALDLSIRAQILTLLKDLQETLSLTLILVAHDLAVVRHVADRVAVMQEGRIVELASALDLFEAPSHEYSRGLLEAAGWRQRSGG